MPLHRLTTPSYIGGLPGTHDKINDPADPSVGGSGVPALSDGLKSVGPNDGTYFVAFGEDATSPDANRPHEALGENTDFLDNVVSGEVPVPDNVDAVAASAVATHQITGDVFVGESGTAQIADEYDRLVQVLDSGTNNEVITSAGLTVKCVGIFDSTDSTDRVGLSTTGFETDPVVHFSPSIPSGTTYRLVFGRRSSLVNIVTNKTSLDAFTRVAIRGSHEVPGETLRFIREAGRRVGGSVAALVATILETPGLGENILGKANSMFMDVDPDAAVGTSGTWAVRFDRDITPKIMLRVNEGTGGDSTWENVFERLAFKDVNTTTSGFGEVSVPLTGVAAGGDDMLRVFEGDPGAPFSILRRLNAVPVITCGDGTNSFGDFNGASALIDAVAFALASGVGSYHIVLKAGAYDADNIDLSTGSNNHIIIEGAVRGVSGDGAIIQCTNTLGATSAALTASGTLNNIILRNLRFQGTGELAFYSLSNFLMMEDCTTDSKGVRIDVAVDMTQQTSSGMGPHVFIMRRCYLNFPGSGSTPVLHYSFRVGTPEARGYVVEDCVLRAPTSNTPILRVENVNIASAGKLGGVLFNRCELELGTATDNAGNMTGNSSAIELVPGTTSNMSLGNFEWRDCNVSISGSGVHRPLFYARFRDGVGILSATSSAVIWKIKGGVWEASNGTLISPFYIGAAAFDDVVPLLEFHAEDVTWGFSGESSNGVPAAEVTGPATAGWAAFFISAARVKMHNVTWLRNTGLSDSGDLFLLGVQRLDIDGLYLTTGWTVGLGSAPEYRVKLSVSNLIRLAMSKANDILIGAPDNAQASLGMLVIVPTTDSTANWGFVVSNANIFGNSGGNGIYLLGGVNGEANGLHLVDCHVESVLNSGFLFDGSPSSVSPLENLRITRCSFVDCSRGIKLNFGSVTNKLHNVVITDCEMRDCTFEGFTIQGTDPWERVHPGLIMKGNTFDNNNGGLDTNQAVFIDSANAVGCFYENAATGVAGNHGKLLMFAGPSDNMRGTEIGYTYDASGTGVLSTPSGAQVATTLIADRRLHQAGIMIHNRFRWTST